MAQVAGNAPALLDTGALKRLIVLLRQRGYEVFGPVARDGAIAYGPLEDVDDLPAGWGDEQEAGRYRLTKRRDGALFGYTAAAQSWKALLHPAETRLFQIRREGRDLDLVDTVDPMPRYALLGVRACELAAIQVQDRALLGDRFADPIYRARRREAFVVAVHCTQAAATCFCASMGTGPRAGGGFDMALTELTGGDRHVFVAEAGTAVGAQVLGDLKCPAAGEDIRREAGLAVEGAACQKRAMDTAGIRELVHDSFEHPRWDDVAARCLACANCTMVCPTCFCTTVEDTSDVAGNQAERWRKWDSCFTQSFSYIHGGSVRVSGKARYRQWLTHKLASWIDQFGTSGCVGCGRCITWCPAAIDITAEVRALREGMMTSPAAAMENQDGDN